MDSLVSIAIVVLCVSAAIFFLAAIGTLRAFQRSMEEAAKSLETVAQDFSDFNDHAMPVLDSLLETADSAKKISGKLAVQIDAIKNVADVVNEFADDLRAFEHEFKRRVQAPILDSAQYIAAAAKGVRTFIRVMRGE